MKYVTYLITCTIFLSIVSCSKYKVGSVDDFNVFTSGTTFKTTDTITFKFTGNPDYIVFYSGEPGKDYTYKDTKSVNPDSVILNFSTNTTTAFATTQPLTVNRVSLLVSTNFSGVMDADNIKRATWRDISDSAKWATTTTTLTSGILKVGQYWQSEKPVYFAYRYISDTVKANYLARKWVVASFVLRSYFNNVMNPLAGGTSGTSIPFTTAGFTNKSILDSTNNWIFGNTALTFNAPATGALPNEDWSISRPFDFTSYNPDLGTSVKTPSAALASYQYIFSKPGTYNVTFVAKNQSAEKTRAVIRQITLDIK